MNSIISISLDSFIYAVRQAFDARSRAHGEFNSHLKYTPFLENTWEKPSESSISALKQSLNEILKHHWHAIAQYQRHQVVNLENISWFAHSMATIFADIEFLFKSVLGHGIPQQDDQAPESKEIWALITDAVQNNLHDYAVLFNTYAEWKYNKPVVKHEPTDWNVRPPCGSLYRTEFKALFDEIRNARFGNKSSKSNSRNNNHSDSHNKKDKHDKEIEIPAEQTLEVHIPNEQSSEEKLLNTHSKENSARKDGEGKQPSRNHRDRNDRDKRKREPRRVFENSTELLQPALDECKKAIETLKNNPSIHEIPLSPQNSFIRRHQHTLITEAGFDTDSRGESTNRHVCIIKKT